MGLGIALASYEAHLQVPLEGNRTQPHRHSGGSPLQQERYIHEPQHASLYAVTMYRCCQLIGFTLGSGFSLVAPYLIMFVILLIRPDGLFGTEEVERV